MVIAHKRCRPVSIPKRKPKAQPAGFALYRARPGASPPTQYGYWSGQRARAPSGLSFPQYLLMRELLWGPPITGPVVIHEYYGYRTAQQRRGRTYYGNRLPSPRDAEVWKPRHIHAATLCGQPLCPIGRIWRVEVCGPTVGAQASARNVLRRGAESPREGRASGRRFGSGAGAAGRRRGEDSGSGGGGGSRSPGAKLSDAGDKAWTLNCVWPLIRGVDLRRSWRDQPWFAPKLHRTRWPEAQKKLNQHDLNAAYEVVRRGVSAEKPRIGGTVLGHGPHRLPARRSSSMAEMEFKKAIRPRRQNSRHCVGGVWAEFSKRPLGCARKAKACFRKAYQEDPADPGGAALLCAHR